MEGRHRYPGERDVDVPAVRTSLDHATAFAVPERQAFIGIYRALAPAFSHQRISIRSSIVAPY
jgi:hypothetical protein